MSRFIRILTIVALAPAAFAHGAVILAEDFEDSALDGRITISTVGTFGAAPGIKAITSLGSTRAFGFGRSTNRYNSFDSYVTNFLITFPQPTAVGTVSFKEMELFDNWGSLGDVLVDGIRLTADFQDYGRLPYNDRQADVTFRIHSIAINASVRTIDLRVRDITDLSEIFIDDLKVTDAPEPTVFAAICMGFVLMVRDRRGIAVGCRSGK